MGKTKHISGDLQKVPISRGVPISKAMQEETLIAWAMNGEEIPVTHGYPLRLVCGGWPKHQLLENGCTKLWFATGFTTVQRCWAPLIVCLKILWLPVLKCLKKIL
ncbi:molybdopterin-dependent oxidoreductase [Antarcticibacterium sp. 1MA-6-2]|uniref:molybdopterin-dependent oxidoreductase n=1 Tax=Antarcticibacterium sp. 1MA-6-2 TaxID=2908210 RepID=UPI00288333BE|nr:molybdopterin-dependent oxidoreductase [Antarcticibacterium sp. 1MA-6-2]